MSKLVDPEAAYQERRAHGQEAQREQDRNAERLATARLVVFLASAVVGWLVLGEKSLSAWWLLPLVACFGYLVYAYDKAARAARRAARRVAFYDQGLARLGDRWAGTGSAGTRFRDPKHPYADDLDLFGAGSLFERISVARTHAGEDTLASWLLEPAPLLEIVPRQQAVRELIPQLELREAFAILGSDVGSDAAFAGLAEWGSAPPVLSNTPVRWIALLLALPALPALFGWLFFGQPAWPFLVIAAAEAVLAGIYFKRAQQVLGQLELRVDELDLLAGLLECLEKARFESPMLVRLHARIRGTGRPASERIHRLHNWQSTLDARRNMILAPLSPFLLWGTQIAFAVEAWRAESGRAIGGWLAALGEFEALASLASFAYENPSDIFPEVRPGDDAIYEADGLAHPLLPVARAVRNDVALGASQAPRVLIVSGSNMSGKSTLLRAVGCSVVLGLAGGTVRAARMSLTRLSLGATLRVQDSLQEGKSRFYAEILRLKLVLDRSRTHAPLLFLLDEILAGTNSHDRHIGAEAAVTGLVERGAIGLMTTHDLALAAMADKLPGQAVNMHFADHFENGQMSFDYRMQPGVVRHSNALELMRSVGLEV